MRQSIKAANVTDIYVPSYNISFNACLSPNGITQSVIIHYY